MISFIIGIPSLVLLFAFITETNPIDPTWHGSVLRTISIFVAILIITGGMIWEDSRKRDIL